MRYAVYLTSPRHHALTRAAERWLGRSAFTGATSAPEAPAEADAATPARYGFHATMRAPFRLRDDRSEDALRDAFARFAAEEGTIAARLTVASLANFVALVAPDQPAIERAHAASLDAFEPFRAPLNAAEIARRRPERLDARGLALLEAYGYPHVLEHFRFHMTLSGPLAPEAIAPVRETAAEYFAAFLDARQPLVFALYVEREANGPFVILDEATTLGEVAE